MSAGRSGSTLGYLLGAAIVLGIAIVFGLRYTSATRPRRDERAAPAATACAGPSTPKSKPKSVTDPVSSDGYATTYESPIDVANPREVDVASLVPSARAF